MERQTAGRVARRARRLDISAVAKMPGGLRHWSIEQFQIGTSKSIPISRTEFGSYSAFPWGERRWVAGTFSPTRRLLSKPIIDTMIEVAASPDSAQRLAALASMSTMRSQDSRCSSASSCRPWASRLNHRQHIRDRRPLLAEANGRTPGKPPGRGRSPARPGRAARCRNPELTDLHPGRQCQGTA